MTDETAQFVAPVALVKCLEAERRQFSLFPTLSDTLMPKSPDLAIFVLTDKQVNRQTNGTDCFTPCACAWGNYH